MKKTIKSFEEYKDRYFPNRDDILDSLLDKPEAYGRELARQALAKARRMLNEL